ncbi:hypothetical protein BGZ61DRAFT_442963 [Ilyonectria robusta]|uniref:uncharacterized protein n=1 Tax=Ilyonectria robusta TaxID=1079257 RepID=UPI001E8ED2C5|nr:uncharacterized protein BGZ61DRAFT_442963 [Ilyonectria robusta]KAH8734697.1 hypothetical protein BGZ61DRAFT_442963 [Ilyonectria robusta]
MGCMHSMPKRSDFDSDYDRDSLYHEIHPLSTPSRRQRKDVMMGGGAQMPLPPAHHARGFAADFHPFEDSRPSIRRNMASKINESLRSGPYPRVGRVAVPTIIVTRPSANGNTNHLIRPF